MAESVSSRKKAHLTAQSPLNLRQQHAPTATKRFMHRHNAKVFYGYCRMLHNRERKPASHLCSDQISFSRFAHPVLIRVTLVSSVERVTPQWRARHRWCNSSQQLFILKYNKYILSLGVWAKHLLVIQAKVKRCDYPAVNICKCSSFHCCIKMPPYFLAPPVPVSQWHLFKPSPRVHWDQ